MDAPIPYDAFDSASVMTQLVFMAIVAMVIIFVIAWVFNTLGKFLDNVSHRRKDKSRRDDKRVFTNKEKEKVIRACLQRCEGTGIFFRCRYKGNDLHGDHWLPHSRGGATSEANLVMLCPACNRKKSDNIPSKAQTIALNWRRNHHRDYIGELPTPVGEWLPRNYVSGKNMDKRYRMIRPTF